MYGNNETASANETVRASEHVRQLANRCGVRLDRITGTGVGGRITTGDVRAAAPRATPETEPTGWFGALEVLEALEPRGRFDSLEAIAAAHAATDNGDPWVVPRRADR